MKVICIDAKGNDWLIEHGIAPLVEGSIYTIREHVVGVKGEGYLFYEIYNYKLRPPYYSSVEPSYHKRRFIPLSTIDELETEVSHKHKHEQVNV